MTYDLYIGDRTFSSWSLRGWLMLQKFGLPFRVHDIGLYSGTMTQDMAPLAPARFVPAIHTPEGDILGESLAIAETLAERHPDRNLWPADATQRMRARWLCAEMASGFTALRGSCPMQLQHVYAGFEASDAVRADLKRIETIWQSARELSGSESGWIFGDYSLADVFYTPVAARIVGYGLPVSDSAHDYCLHCLSDPDFLQWRSDGLKRSYNPFPYPVEAEITPWPS